MLDWIIQYWIQLVFGLMITFAGYLYRQVKKYRHHLRSIENTVITLLKFKIMEIYEQIKDKDMISMSDKEKISKLYNEYKQFEPNGLINDLVRTLNNKKVE